MHDILNHPCLRDSGCPALWRYFVGITQIPRPSGCETRIREHLCALAADNGWAVRDDAAGNIVFAVPGRGVLAAAAPLVLQGHMDMVCEKNGDVVHDFMTDPIRLEIVDGWLQACGTTLGADNGIALALALSVATAEVPHRLPLELLFTVAEETGLSGALQLDAGIISGRRLLNLDAEEDDVFIIGCAGAAEVRARFAKTANGSGADAARVRLRGLRGGHSGVDIADGRANAIRVMAELLCQWRQHSPEMKVRRFSAGDKVNAIPRECLVELDGVADADLRAALDAACDGLRRVEPDVTYDLARGRTPTSASVPPAVIDFLAEIPNGVLAMDASCGDLVGTSSSVGVVADEPNSVTVQIMPRALIDADKSRLLAQLLAAAHRAGAETTVGHDFPGWTPRPAAPLLARARRSFQELFAAEPRVQSIHAGLETGILGARLETDDLLSIGPSIENAHSPDERLRIAGAERTHALLLRMVTTA